MNTATGRRLLLAGVVAVGLVAALSVVFAGPVQVGPPRWHLSGEHFTPPPQPPGPSRAPLPRGTGGAAAARIMGLVLEAMVVALALALLVVIVRWSIRRFRARRRLLHRTGGPDDAAALSAAAADAVVSAPVMQRGIQKALHILAEGRRTPRDAVVAAWLGLEETAMLAGARRGVAETPTEYTARIIGRFETDRDAADALVRLYQDVRFGAHPVDRDVIVVARSCLVRLQESWHEDSRAATVPHRPEGPVG